MKYSISSLHFCPVKSLSFTDVESCAIKESIGIVNDRIFALTRNIDLKKAKLIEKLPKERKLHNFLTLKNSPFLNKYHFKFENNILTLYKANTKLVTASINDSNELLMISEVLSKQEPTLNLPIFLLKNVNNPFFDTSHSENYSNTISLINLNSIRNFEKKINEKIEFERFRGNIYIEGLEAWKEREWLNKTIKINNIKFKIKNNIPRCSATNLQPNTDNVTINLPMTLMKHYNHIDMGIYLTSLSDGKIHIGDKVVIDE